VTPDDLSRLADALIGGVAASLVYANWRVWQILRARTRFVGDQSLGPLLDGAEGADEGRRASAAALLCRILPLVQLDEVRQLGPARGSAYYNILNPAGIRTPLTAELAALLTEAAARTKDAAALPHLSNMIWCLDAPPFTPAQSVRIRQAVDGLRTYELDQLEHGHLPRPSQREPETLLRPAESAGAFVTELLLPSQGPTSAAAEVTRAARER
jgi:hypothetical protein